MTYSAFCSVGNGQLAGSECLFLFSMNLQTEYLTKLLAAPGEPQPQYPC